MALTSNDGMGRCQNKNDDSIDILREWEQGESKSQK